MQDDNIIYGINPIQQLLDHNPSKIKELFVSSTKHDTRTQALLNTARAHGIAVQNIEVKKLDHLIGTKGHQGVMAKLKASAILTEASIAELVNSVTDPLFLVLDGVQDPHNLGACLRTCDAAAVTAVIVPRDNAVGITAAVRKVASGAADIIPFLQVSNLARALKELQDRGVWIVGTAADSDTIIYEQDLTGPLAIVLGSEGEGMRQLTRKHCDFLVKLPMLGQVTSLNVAVACGICLYEALRQRKFS